MNSPASAFIEVHRPSIRFDDPKSKCLVPPTAYFTFRMRQQLSADSGPAAVASNPQITHPFVLGHGYTNDLSSRHRQPG